MSEERKIFTLKQVTNSIQKVLNERYSTFYWIQTEVFKLNYTSKGHCYPELVHKEEGKVLAEMRGTIWASNFEKISKNFAQTVKEPLRDGMSLLLCAKIVFHPLYGISLEILDIDPTYSLGELQKERNETIKKLTQEGILNNNQKLEFPFLPKRIALISQEGIKGLQDFYTIIEKTKYKWFFMLFPAQLNGDLAINSIQLQLDKINKVKHHFDLVLIIRGGGGEIGLSCYNNYDLAKKIATFSLPIMTGIGHSSNITVSELVAFRNAITPSELADFLIQAFEEIDVPLINAKKIILKESLNILVKKWLELKNEIRFLSKSSSIFVLNTKNQLKDNLLILKENSQKSVRQENNKIQRYIYTLNENSKQLLNQARNQIQTSRINLKNVSILATNKFTQKEIEYKKIIHLGSEKIVLSNRNQLSYIENSIRLIDPINVLKRGYTITLKNGQVISENNPILVGDVIETKTAAQEIVSEVKKINQH